MADHLGDWYELTNDLFNAVADLDAAVCVVVAREVTGADPKSDRVLAACLARQRVDDVRARIDLFLDEHVGRLA